MGPFSHLSPPIAVCSRPLLSLPVSCLQSRFSARQWSLPSPCSAVLPLAPPSPSLCFCQRAELQQGAAGGWETLSFRFVFPCGVPSDPLEPIPACPVPRILPDHSHQLILPISPPAKPHLPSASPHILSFPFYMISAPSPITLSLLSTQPLVRIFIPITPLCTSPSVPKYLFPKPFPTPSPSQPSVLHPTYSQPHSDSQEPVLPSRVPLLSCSSSSLAPQCFSLLWPPPPAPPS